MAERISCALAQGWERMAAWSDLLDDINVFPVADGDTGRNLTISLMPLRRSGGGSGDGMDRLVREIHRSAVGNSGNIAACFLSGFLAFDDPESLPQAAVSGRDAAWTSVGRPKAGTMLTVFDALAAMPPSHAGDIAPLIEHLGDAVRSGPDLLPELKAAGVADAGALGMFIFLEGFFTALFDVSRPALPVTERFGALLAVPRVFRYHRPEGRCVHAVIRPLNTHNDIHDNGNAIVRTISQYGESTVVSRDLEGIKFHFHTENDLPILERIAPMGEVLEWSAEPMTPQENPASIAPFPIHIMTDAAGSVDRAEARKWGITVLDSYVVVDGRALPETLMDPAKLYAAMRSGARVSTAQASVFERRERYASVLGRFDKVLYLCVGSAYTGNFDAVSEWKAAHDPDDRLTVIDTGAASGRLGAMVLSTARYAARANSPESVIAHARKAVHASEEYVFLDRLHYLARGGRISRTGAFFGDMLHMKPVITPTPQGAARVGMTKNRNAQLAFALKRLERRLDSSSRHLILLQYSDNETWVEKTVLGAIEERFGASDIRLQPLSLTSGAHMGPGAWAMAFLPARAI